MSHAVRYHFPPSSWEKQVGYCRAIRSGNIVAVTGTTSVDDKGQLFAPGDAYSQAKRIFEIIFMALKEVGAEPHHIIRTRIFVVDIARDWKEIGRAHAEVFKGFPPACTMVEVKSLIDPALLLEIEADAVVPDGGSKL